MTGAGAVRVELPDLDGRTNRPSPPLNRVMRREARRMLGPFLGLSPRRQCAHERLRSRSLLAVRPALGRPMSVYTQAHDADCLRAAVASLLSVPPELLPEVDHDCEDWFGDYNRRLHDGGWPFQLLSSAVVPVIDGRWIAVVPSLTQNGTHAVVMDGHRLYHDPGRKKKYASIEPGEAKCAIHVVATGPGWGPGRDPTWVPRELTGVTPGREDDSSPLASTDSRTENP